MKIDFVLPWVDGSDPQWQQRRTEHQPYNTLSKDANANARFRDMETLKYVLRAIETNCPWYNKIYLITEGHSPAWLRTEHPNIELVRHQDLFIDKSHLPVFNSVAIEMNLVNLKGLSETFVYMNDDFVIWNKLDPSRFFVDGKPVDFLSHSAIPRNRLFGLFKKRDSWIHSLNNVLKLYNQKFAPLQLESRTLYHESYRLSDKVNNFLLQHLFKRLIWLNHWHHPQPLRRETLEAVYTTFKDEMMRSSQNRFRANSDLNQYMYRYWHLIKGDFHPYRHDDDLIANLDAMSILETLIERLEKSDDINFVCFNDSVHLNDTEYDAVKQKLTQFLEAHFPNKASFEK